MLGAQKVLRICWCVHPLACDDSKHVCGVPKIVVGITRRVASTGYVLFFEIGRLGGV